jgi:Uma2 family endonuclease
MQRKLCEYFQAGVRLVWHRDPATRTVTVHASPTESTVVREGERLDGGEVLPGFTLPLSSLFVVEQEPEPSPGEAAGEGPL